MTDKGRDFEDWFADHESDRPLGWSEDARHTLAVETRDLTRDVRLGVLDLAAEYADKANSAALIANEQLQATEKLFDTAQSCMKLLVWIAIMLAVILVKMY